MHKKKINSNRENWRLALFASQKLALNNIMSLLKTRPFEKIGAER